jgi:DNA helicase II / ATP-dependent DNA helicase PcrA
MKLNICADRQKILDSTGHTLVIGGPGSGKTTIALLKSIGEINKNLRPGQSILFLSFSRAAVSRIAQSSKTLIPKEFKNRLSIQTFHSFFWEVIKTHSYLTGTPKKLQIILPHEEEAERSGREKDSDEWLKAKEQLLSISGKITFDQFSSKAFQLFNNSSKIRNLYTSRYPLIIVDEAQDTGDEQWACIELLSTKSKILALADLEQQIYDFRKDVNPERMKQIISSISPIQIDLGTQNNRSPGSEVTKFGNDLLIGNAKADAYKGMFQLNFQPKADRRDASIRQSLGILSKKIQTATGKAPESIVFLASWGKGVQTISRALKGNDPSKEIPHQILFDETQVLLASKLIALTLEPKDKNKIFLHAADACDLIASIFQAQGKPNPLKEAGKFKKWAQELRSGVTPKRAKPVKCITEIIERLILRPFSGNPTKDWFSAKQFYVNSGSVQLKKLVFDVELIMTFKRGKIISGKLSDQWKRTRTYSMARRILENALSEDQLLSGNSDLKGVSVMTMHKSKGKEFDGVIVFYDSNVSPLLARGDESPFIRSRKLLRVAITRAKSATLLLTDAYNPCPLLEGFTFEAL